MSETETDMNGHQGDATMRTMLYFSLCWLSALAVVGCTLFG